MDSRLSDTVAFVKKLVGLYYCDRDAEELISFLDEDVSWIGPGAAERGHGADKAGDFFKKALSSGDVPPCRILDEDFRPVRVDENHCVVYGSCVVRADDSVTGILLEFIQRFTFVVKTREEGLKVVHMHVSNPCSRLREGEYFPASAGRSNYDYLNGIIKSKTEQIDVMLGSIGGGLKGSVNDEFYTYFYVSDELCAMLGYTRDEFMKMSSGTAVGAVYSPDRERAVAEAAACFERGESYYTEYRMRKKDGSLIWVSDSGRKVANADGEVKINSLITDITRRRMDADRIAKQKNFLQFLYDTMPTGIVQFTVEGDPLLLNSNRAARAIFGYSDEDVSFLEGKSVLAFVYSGDADIFRSFFALMKSTGKTYSYEHRGVCLDGTIKWIGVIAGIIVNEEGEKVLQVIFNDITEKKERELELDRERERYRMAVQSSADIIFDYDIERDVFKTYRGEETEKAVEVREGVIKNYENTAVSRSLFHPDDIDKLREILVSLNFQPMELRMRYPEDPEGVYRWSYIRGTVVRKDGRPVQIVGTVRDIADFKETEEENLRLQEQVGMALRSSYEQVYETNLKEDTCNSLNFHGVRFKKDPMPGGHMATVELLCREVCHPDEKDMFLELYSTPGMKKYFDEGGMEIYREWRMKNSEGEYVWQSYLTRRVPWDADIFFTFVKDIDKTKKTEERNRKILQDALASAEYANNAKSDFLSRISHDIRTPMNAIIGMTAIAGNYLGDVAKVGDCLSKIDVSAKFLLSLINDVLDMSKIESGKMVLSKDEFEIVALMADIETLIRPQASEKSIDFKVCSKGVSGRRYIGDTLRIKQILMNLLSNALKFTPEGDIELTAEERESRGIEADIIFTVRDTGIGMNAEFLKKIYDPFEQGQAGKEDRETGSGLGLAITKNLITLMGGDIEVKSAPAEGTSFVVRLTLKFAKSSVSEAQTVDQSFGIRGIPDEELTFHGERILLAEDNDINMEIARTMLELKELEVEGVCDGEQAVKKFAGSPVGYYNAVLMDIRMPLMNGLAAAHAIRSLDRSDAGTIPIIAMTANAFKEDREKAAKSGMNAYVVKPVDARNLYETLYAIFYVDKRGVRF